MIRNVTTPAPHDVLGIYIREIFHKLGVIFHQLIPVLPFFVPNSDILPFSLFHQASARASAQNKQPLQQTGAKDLCLRAGNRSEETWAFENFTCPTEHFFDVCHFKNGLHKLPRWSVLCPAADEPMWGILQQEGKHRNMR